MNISTGDAYAIGRALMDKEPVEGLVLTPLAEMLVRQMTGAPQERIEKLKEFFGSEVLAQIFAIDPDGEVPTESVEQLGAYVPPLPEDVVVEPQEHVGVWLDEYLNWISSRASTTSRLFLESGGLWLIGLATARRAGLHLSIGNFYNNFYVLWSAPTTVYAKSTGLRFIEQLARASMPHMLLASNNTPELLLYKLSGKVPENINDLSVTQQETERAGVRYAGQRGSIVDEAASLFAGKKYMEGLVDLFMQLYDCPPLVEHEFKTQGKLVVEKPALSLLLGTTPSRLQEVFADGEWTNGLLPRFALLTPDNPPMAPPFVHRWDQNSPIPGNIVSGLRDLAFKLPEPAMSNMEEGFKQTVGQVIIKIDDNALQGFNNYKSALWHHLMQLDNRLSGVYGRLHVQALKIAMSLRLIDWATMGGNLEITLPYWARAQQIAETWRASAHRMLQELNYSPDMRDEDAVLTYLRSQRHAKSLRQIHRATSIHRESDVKRAVGALFSDGVIQKVQMSHGGYAYVVS